MLRVSTYLAPSGVHGIGLYAGEDIPAGTLIWQFTPRIDKIFTPIQLRRLCAGMTNVELQHLCAYLYKRGERYFMVTDNTRFINHCEEGHNISLLDDFHEVAIRDIAEGEELLENYFINYDLDDAFCLEARNLDPAPYFTLNAREKRRFVKGQNLPR